MENWRTQRKTLRQHVRFMSDRTEKNDLVLFLSLSAECPLEISRVLTSSQVIFLFTYNSPQGQQLQICKWFLNNYIILFYINQFVTWELTLLYFRQHKRFSRPTEQVTLLFFLFILLIRKKNLLPIRLFTLFILSCLYNRLMGDKKGDTKDESIDTVLQ